MLRTFNPRRGACVLALATVCTAQAQDDRWNDQPTGWTYLYGATTAQIADLVSDGQRVFNAERVGVNSYDVIGVTNSGEYAVTGSTTVYTQTGTALSNYLNNNNRRLLDLEPYESGGTENFVAVTVPNSGATAVAEWGWLYRVSAQTVIDWIEDTTPALRLVDLDVYTLNGTKYYSAVAVRNTGSQFQNWWYYIGATAGEITTALTQNDARLIDIEVDTPPTIGQSARYTAIMVGENPGGGWWYPSLSSSQVTDMLNQNGARLTCLERFQDAFGNTRFAVAMVDNANAETRRVRGLLDDETADGVYGFKVKQVGGPVIASLNESFAFEPASMIKILHGVYSIDRCAAGLDSLSNTLLNDDTCNPNECPSTNPSGCNATNETVEQVLRRMLRVSDNNSTREMALRYGVANLNNFAASFGLDETQLNHTLGCLCQEDYDYNLFSARDAVDLYEGIADGTFFSQTWQDELFSIMNNYDELGNSRITSIINQEAAGTNLTSAEITQFRNAFNSANKGGGYGCGNREWRTDGGWASIPFKITQPFPLTINREYALAIFMHDTTSPTATETYNIFWELIRTPIRDALESWDAACGPQAITNQPDSTSAQVGSSAQFQLTSVGTTGGATYRWQRLVSGNWQNISNQAGRYSGATTTTLTISNIIEDDERSYRCVVSNDCSSVNSQSAFLTVTLPCPADLAAPFGVLNFFDVSAFLSLYNAQSPQADLAAPFGTWNFFDVSAFLSSYGAGCP